MHGLVDRLEDHRHGQAEQAADADHRRRAEMGDMVLLELVQRDRLDQRDMHLVGDGDGAREGGAAAPGLLRHGKERRDRIAGMGVIGGKEGVVEIELAHRGGIGPGGPFGADRQRRGEADQRGAAGTWSGKRHGAGGRAARATAELSMSRAATSAAVSASIEGRVASEASFQASCSSRGRREEAGWTVTAWGIMRGVLKPKGDGGGKAIWALSFDGARR